MCKAQKVKTLIKSPEFDTTGKDLSGFLVPAPNECIDRTRDAMDGATRMNLFF
jgi:hypothetical protein